jgi:hypothetical protein
MILSNISIVKLILYTLSVYSSYDSLIITNDNGGVDLCFNGGITNGIAEQHCMFVDILKFFPSDVDTKILKKFIQNKEIMNAVKAYFKALNPLTLSSNREHLHLFQKLLSELDHSYFQRFHNQVLSIYDNEDFRKIPTHLELMFAYRSYIKVLQDFAVKELKLPICKNNCKEQPKLSESVEIGSDFDLTLKLINVLQEFIKCLLEYLHKFIIPIKNESKFDALITAIEKDIPMFILEPDSNDMVPFPISHRDIKTLVENHAFNELFNKESGGFRPEGVDERINEWIRNEGVKISSILLNFEAFLFNNLAGIDTIIFDKAFDELVDYASYEILNRSN